MRRCCVLAGLTAALHLNGRVCEHAQIPNPDAARGRVTRAAQTAASAAAGAWSSCRHHRCLPQHTHLRSTAPVATLKASYLFQSQHSTYSNLRKARAFLFKMLSAGRHLAGMRQHFRAALLRPRVPCAQHAVTAHAAAS